MIRPQTNRFRKAQVFQGPWDFRKDPFDQGGQKGWFKGFKKEKSLLVPASWNEQAPDLKNFLGPAWYQKDFDFFPNPKWPRVFFRFDSVHYFSTVWLNGKKLGSHEGGHLPFEFEITEFFLRKGPNRLVLRVEGLLKPDRVPPGNVPFDPKDAFNNQFNPPASFDFFPYCGIQREVTLYTTPRTLLRDVTVRTTLSGKKAFVKVSGCLDGKGGQTVRFTLEGFGWRSIRHEPLVGRNFQAVFPVPKPRLWAPGSPNLYELRVELLKDGKPVDEVRMPMGIRTVQVRGNQILLNGKTVFLKGFGRHEDHPLLGRALPDKVRAKDFQNMAWTGANSYRTSHYPYSEKDLDLADRLGFLVIDETPAVGLFFHPKGLPKRLRLCRQFTREMIGRDKNHPSVVMWSLANEPHSHRPEARPFFKDLARLARGLDPTRPVTLVSYLGAAEESFRFLDVVCVNRYFGWYSEPGDLPKAFPRLSKDLDAIHRKFRKLLLVTEFGADALPGSHANPPVLFSEEYQAELIEGYLRVMARKPFVRGAQVWNLNDFRTAQAVHRPNGMNYKGVFTRNRRPKLAAYRLRKLWREFPV